MGYNSLGLYVHIPFCLRKCFYCDFPSYSGMGHLMDPYLHALKIELKNSSTRIGDRKVNTIFFGGGTPTLYSSERLIDLLKYIKDTLCISQDAEITIEANPETLNGYKLEALKDEGINRLSLGMQAGQEKHLRKLGRGHTLKDVRVNMDLARSLGFDNINLDLIFGLPHQTLEEWVESLAIACKFGAEHISAYSLIIEEGTPFFEMLNGGSLNALDEDAEREMYHTGAELLKNQGYYHYEISNFAKPGKECAHNLIYWHNGEYIGIGSGAHSSLGGVRWSNHNGISTYIESISQKGCAIESKQKISPAEQRFETIMMGLRLVKGVSKAKFYNRFGQGIRVYYGKAIDQLKGLGMLEETTEYIRHTEKGFDLQNQVLTYFMDEL
ncbi:MAG: oxygen-independent coproporphyrinogen III oxidase [Clostridiales bacterium]|nr:oxygen-independent coproporphyrinogen III oxidase [Clostridiales bacterium]